MWGAAWFGGTLVALSAAQFLGVLPPAYSWNPILEVATNLGIFGSVAGGAFSGFIRWRYRGRSILEISSARFGVGGAAVAGSFIPLFITVGRLATGAPWLGVEALAVSGLLAAVLGGLTAGGSLVLAQRGVEEIAGSASGHLPGEARGPARLGWGAG